MKELQLKTVHDEWVKSYLNDTKLGEAIKAVVEGLSYGYTKPPSAKINNTEYRIVTPTCKCCGQELS